MEEYRVEVRVKNNLLYSRIMQKYGSIVEFCKKEAVSKVIIGGLINFKYNIYNRDGSIKKEIEKIANILDCGVDDIIPKNYEVKKNNFFAKQVDAMSVCKIESINQPQLTYEQNYNKKELLRILDKASECLNERERKVIIMRYKYGSTLRECGEELGVTSERSREIETKAIRKLICYLKRKKMYEDCKDMFFE